jgi:hypothetical protein
MSFQTHEHSHDLACERVAIEFNGLAGRGFGMAALGRSPLWKNVLAGLATGPAAIWTCDWPTESGGRTMNLEVELLKRLPHLFNALNSLIEDDGVYLYLVLVWLAMAVIAWIVSGGLRKRMQGNAARIIPIVIILPQPPKQPETPVVDIEAEQVWDDDD